MSDFPCSLIFSNSDMKYLAVALPPEINAFRMNGDFDGEIFHIRKLLSDTSIPKALRKRLELELVIAYGMKNDYNEDEDGLFGRLKDKFPMLTENDFRKIVDSGNVDLIYKNGKEYFQNSAYSNILSTHEKFLNSVSRESHDTSPVFNSRRHENHDIMKAKGFRAFRYTVRHTLWLSERYSERYSEGNSGEFDDSNRNGKLLRLWFPFPAASDEQSEIKLISSDLPITISDVPTSGAGYHCTAFCEAEYRRGEKYSIEYSYINRALWHDVDPSRVLKEQPHFYTEEYPPQIIFTPFLKMLAKEIRDNADANGNPYLLAKAVYSWVTFNVKYSYMREYFYIDNIPEFAALNRRGDCGVQALLFITLCRILGIPARWQSGSAVTPHRIGSHDWAQFYVAPYGWLYADPSFGGGALRNGDTLLHEHYFGNLDPDRLVSCTDFMMPFSPEKKFLRRDPYDNQSGEAEFSDLAVMWGDIHSERAVIKSEEIF